MRYFSVVSIEPSLGLWPRSVVKRRELVFILSGDPGLLSRSDSDVAYFTLSDGRFGTFVWHERYWNSYAYRDVCDEDVPVGLNTDCTIMRVVVDVKSGTPRHPQSLPLHDKIF